MFAGSASDYDEFMGRFSVQLGPQMAALAEVESGQRALDVGCGTGALTAELVSRLGAESVSAIDPSEQFVAAILDRYPRVTVRQAVAEEIPFDDDAFDASLAQLAVHFMTDPVAGLSEMRRVTRAGGVVAACVWDYGNGRGPLSMFWDAVRRLDPDVPDESDRPGTRQGQLVDYFTSAGLGDVVESTVSASREFTSFDEWWRLFELGVGPVGAYKATIEADRWALLRDIASEMVPAAPFTVAGWAWSVRGIA
jgi:SAM-dependent methyltransferase